MQLEGAASIVARDMAKADVWLVAALLIARFAGEARAVAVECAGALEEQGDDELCALWKRIGESIAEFQRSGRGTREILH
jgi:hypothetical protein